MKYLVLLLVIMLVIWLARSARKKPSEPPAGTRKSGSGRPGKDEVMLTCAHCGLHLPAGEALPGRGGVFCSEEHRAIAESRHGPG